MFGGASDAKEASGKTGVFLELESFVVRVGARGIKQKQAKGVTGPAVVTQEAFETGVLDTRLFVNGGDGGGRVFGDVAKTRVISFGAAQNGIDERGGGGTKVQGGNRSASGGFQQRLIFRGSEEQLVGAVAIVVKRFHAGRESAGSLLVREELGANQIAPQLGTQVGSVEAAENAVPIGVVALRAKKKVARFLELLAGFGAAAARGRSVNAASDVQHFLVQQVGLGVLAEKTAPGTAAQEREHFVARSELLQDFVVALANAGGKRPFHHLGVGGGGQVGAARGSVRGKVLAGRGSLQPGGVFLEGEEEFFEPGVLVTVVKGAGPDAEFLHVVAHGGHLIRMSAGGLAEISNDLLDGAEGNEITQSFLAGEDANGLAVIFGDVVGEQLVRLEAGGEEVDVVENGIA